MTFIREITYTDLEKITLASLKNFVARAESLKMSDDAEVFTGGPMEGFERLRSITARGE